MADEKQYSVEEVKDLIKTSNLIESFLVRIQSFEEQFNRFENVEKELINIKKTLEKFDGFLKLNKPLQEIIAENTRLLNDNKLLIKKLKMIESNQSGHVSPGPKVDDGDNGGKDHKPQTLEDKALEYFNINKKKNFKIVKRDNLMSYFKINREEADKIIKYLINVGKIKNNMFVF